MSEQVLKNEGDTASAIFGPEEIRPSQEGPDPLASGPASGSCLHGSVAWFASQESLL